MRGQIRIGTSGWIYKHWRGIFYPTDLPSSRWFSHYARHFDTVEINNTFYRLPPAATFDAWQGQAPPGFLYAVKANRFLTHMKKLQGPLEPMQRLLSHVRRLGTLLGPILYQLPPHWRKDLLRLAEFFDVLPGNLTHVIEFRERSWLADDTRALLQARGVSLCIHDILPRHPRWVTGRSVYVRFHGVRYHGDYRRNRLRRWAEWISARAAEGHNVYAYFNNDIGGHAVTNALMLKELMQRTR